MECRHKPGPKKASSRAKSLAKEGKNKTIPKTTIESELHFRNPFTGRIYFSARFLPSNLCWRRAGAGINKNKPENWPLIFRFVCRVTLSPASSPIYHLFAFVRFKARRLLVSLSRFDRQPEGNRYIRASETVACCFVVAPDFSLAVIGKFASEWGCFAGVNPRTKLRLGGGTVIFAGDFKGRYIKLWKDKFWNDYFSLDY